MRRYYQKEPHVIQLLNEYKVENMSLQNLCRLRIRQSLTKDTVVLESSVLSLGLPKQLRDYVQFY